MRINELQKAPLIIKDFSPFFNAPICRLSGHFGLKNCHSWPFSPKPAPSWKICPQPFVEKPKREPDSKRIFEHIDRGLKNEEEAFVPAAGSDYGSVPGGLPCQVILSCSLVLAPESVHIL